MYQDERDLPSTASVYLKIRTFLKDLSRCVVQDEVHRRVNRRRPVQVPCEIACRKHVSSPEYRWDAMNLLSGGRIKRWRWKGMGILAGILCLLLIGVSGYQAYQTRNVPAPLAPSVELYTFHDEKLVGYSARDGSARWTQRLSDSYTGRL